MQQTMRLALIIDGEAREAVVSVDATRQALARLEGQAKTSGGAVEGAMTKAGRGVKDATGLSTQQLQQMQFQLQDMAIGLSSGQSPFTVITQQGSQLAQSFVAGTGPVAAMKMFWQAVVGFVSNPLNLLVAGLALATTAVVKFYDAIAGGASSTDALLDRHKEQIDRIAGAYRGAKGEAIEYFKASAPTMLLDAQITRTEMRGQILDQREGLGGRLQDLVGSARAQEEQLALQLEGGLDAWKAIATAVAEAAPGLDSGATSASDLTDQITAIATKAPDGAFALREFAKSLTDQLDPLRESERALEQSEAAIKLLTGTATQSDKAVIGLSTSIGEMGRVALKSRGSSSYFGDLPAGAAAGSSAFKSLLDLIADKEGTDRGRGYNETLGSGKFTGGPVDLVAMTLNQVLDLQRKMLADPANSFNSSAVGRYQITSQTLRDVMPRLGLDGNTLFTPEVQDRIALAIVNMAGRDVDALRGRWEGLKFASQGSILKAYDASSGERVSAAEAERKVTADDAKAAASFAAAIADAARHSDLLGMSLGQSAAETARNRVEQRLWAEAERDFGDRLKSNATLHAEVAAQIRARGDAAAAAAAKEDALTRKTELEKRNAEAAARAYADLIGNFRGLGDGLVASIAAAREAGDSWMKAFGAGLDALRGKALSILDSFIDKALDAALFGGEAGTGGVLGSLFASLFAGGTSPNPLQNALGNAFQGGRVTTFASGGVVGGPTLAPMALMGEAGPEAIMPLTRMPSGHLGVRAEGGGGGLNVNVHNYAGVPVRAERHGDGRGGADLDIVVGDMVNRHLAQGGSDGVLAARYGVAPKTEAWG